LGIAATGVKLGTLGVPEHEPKATMAMTAGSE
jgi:hypothetical protein